MRGLVAIAFVAIGPAGVARAQTPPDAIWLRCDVAGQFSERDIQTEVSRVEIFAIAPSYMSYRYHLGRPFSGANLCAEGGTCALTDEQFFYRKEGEQSGQGLVIIETRIDRRTGAFRSNYSESRGDRTTEMVVGQCVGIADPRPPRQF